MSFKAVLHSESSPLLSRGSYSRRDAEAVRAVVCADSLSSEERARLEKQADSLYSKARESGDLHDALADYDTRSSRLPTIDPIDKTSPRTQASAVRVEQSQGWNFWDWLVSFFSCFFCCAATSSVDFEKEEAPFGYDADGKPFENSLISSPESKASTPVQAFIGVNPFPSDILGERKVTLPPKNIVSMIRMRDFQSVQALNPEKAKALREREAYERYTAVAKELGDQLGEELNQLKSTIAGLESFVGRMKKPGRFSFNVPLSKDPVKVKKWVTKLESMNWYREAVSGRSFEQLGIPKDLPWRSTLKEDYNRLVLTSQKLQALKRNSPALPQHNEQEISDMPMYTLNLPLLRSLRKLPFELKIGTEIVSPTNDKSFVRALAGWSRQELAPGTPIPISAVFTMVQAILADQAKPESARLSVHPDLTYKTVPGTHRVTLMPRTNLNGIVGNRYQVIATRDIEVTAKNGETKIYQVREQFDMDGEGLIQEKVEAVHRTVTVEESTDWDAEFGSTTDYSSEDDREPFTV